MASNPLEKLGISMDDIRNSVEADVNLAELAAKVVAHAKSIAPVDEGEYAAGIRITKKPRGGKAVVSATNWKSHLIEFGTGAPGPTKAFAVMEKTAHHFRGTLGMEDAAQVNDE